MTSLSLPIGYEYVQRIIRPGEQDEVTRYRVIGEDGRGNPVIDVVCSWREELKLPKESLSERLGDYIAIGLAGLMFVAGKIFERRLSKLSDLEN